MTIIACILIFLSSCFVLVFCAKVLIDSLTGIAKYLGWKEFVVAFFTVSLGSVAPEFFIGIVSAINNVPELAFGNILGQNILLLSFTVGLCAIVLKDGIEVESKIVRGGATFTVISALLPLFLIYDGVLSRADGIVLLMSFGIFFYWLFSKKKRFSKIYDDVNKEEKNWGPLFLIKKVSLLLLVFLLVILSAQGIIESSSYFSSSLGVSIPVIGIIIVAIGVGLPETYFSFVLAKKGQSWMILGGLMGAITMSSTLALGTISLIRPIVIDMATIPSFYIARIFLILCALFFLFFIRTNRRISTLEGIVLIFAYISFIILGILIR